jgi:hypothetical protein
MRPSAFFLLHQVDLELLASDEIGGRSLLGFSPASIAFDLTPYRISSLC